MKSAIYSITNVTNNKIYIGGSKEAARRLSGHKWMLKTNKHPNSYLQEDFLLYDIENFKFEIVEECEEQYLHSQENWWCNMLNVHDRKYGYNDRYTSANGKSKMSEKSRQKMRDAHKGVPLSTKHKESLKEARKGKGNGLLGYKQTDEHKANCKKALTGLKRTVEYSEERRKKCRTYIIQRDLSGNVICVFTGVAEMERTSSYKSESIYKAAINKSVSRKSYWEIITFKNFYKK
jgi:group I intron endonuclease